MATTVSPMVCLNHRLLLFTCFQFNAESRDLSSASTANLNKLGSIDHATLTQDLIRSLNIEPGTTNSSFSLQCWSAKTSESKLFGNSKQPKTLQMVHSNRYHVFPKQSLIWQIFASVVSISLSTMSSLFSASAAILIVGLT